MPTAPLAVAALVITGGPSVITNDTACAGLVPLALLAVTVTLVVPTAVGVPEIRPVVVLTVSPAGRAVALKLVGALAAVIWKLNATPVCPFAGPRLVTTGAIVEIEKFTVCCAVAVAFCAVSRTAVLPLATGVPVTAPVLVFRVRPDGRGSSAPNRVGLLVATIW